MVLFSIYKVRYKYNILLNKINTNNIQIQEIGFIKGLSISYPNTLKTEYLITSVITKNKNHLKMVLM